jgi:transcriptional regulator with XRE-family HTH domain
MKTPVGQRIKELRCHYNLAVKEFAANAGLSHVAIFNLENGRTIKPHMSSVQRIASVYGSSAGWILYGKNEMLPNGTKDLYSYENQSDDFWKDEAYLEIKNRNLDLEREIGRLWQMLSHLMGSRPNNIQRMEEAS